VLRSRSVLVPLACVLTLVLAGCGDDTGADDGSGGRSLRVPVGDVDLDVDAPAYSTGDEIRIGEVTVPVDPTPESWVVGPHGVYYLTDETLWFADEDGSEEVATVGHSELVLSPDRSLLGLVDLASGPPDQFDTPVAVPVVFDLETGEEVLRAEPAEPTAEDDLAVLYGEIEPVVVGFDDDAVYAVDPLRGGLNRFPLDGGDPTEVSDTEEDPVRATLEDALPGSEVGLDPQTDDRLLLAPEGEYAPYSGRLSPDGSYFFGAGSQQPAGIYDVRTGRRTALTDEIRTFGAWLADGSFYAITVPPGGQPPEDVGSSYYPEQLGTYDARIVVCPVDGSGCEPVSERLVLPHPLADDAVTVFPES
jgi:hypothetical protein